MALRMKRDDFANGRIRPGVIEAIRKEAPDHAGCEVLMCFTTDPFQPINGKHHLAEQAIEALHDGGCRVVVLTKGGARSRAGMAMLRDGDKYGVTLTSLDDETFSDVEAGAATPSERIEVLGEAHGRGLYTWVSLEPVLDPSVALEIIRKTHRIVTKLFVNFSCPALVKMRMSFLEFVEIRGPMPARVSARLKRYIPLTRRPKKHSRKNATALAQELPETLLRLL